MGKLALQHRSQAAAAVARATQTCPPSTSHHPQSSPFISFARHHVHQVDLANRLARGSAASDPVSEHVGRLSVEEKPPGATPIHHHRQRQLCSSSKQGSDGCPLQPVPRRRGGRRCDARRHRYCYSCWSCSCRGRKQHFRRREERGEVSWELFFRPPRRRFGELPILPRLRSPSRGKNGPSRGQPSSSFRPWHMYVLHSEGSLTPCTYTARHVQVLKD